MEAELASLLIYTPHTMSPHRGGHRCCMIRQHCRRPDMIDAAAAYIWRWRAYTTFSLSVLAQRRCRYSFCGGCHHRTTSAKAGWLKVVVAVMVAYLYRNEIYSGAKGGLCVLFLAKSSSELPTKNSAFCYFSSLGSMLRADDFFACGCASYAAIYVWSFVRVSLSPA